MLLNFPKMEFQPFSCAFAMASFGRPECRRVMSVPSPFFWNVTVTVDSSPKVFRDIQEC